MPERSSVRRLTLLTVLAVSILVAGGVISKVYASIPDSNGRINACYTNKGGALRVIDTANPTDTCSKLETAISWDQNKSTSTGTTANIAKGRVAMDHQPMLYDLENVTSFAPSTHQDPNDSNSGYCLEVPFNTYVSTSQPFGGDNDVSGHVLLKNSEADQYPFFPSPSGTDPYCPDAKYNVYIFANNFFTNFSFVIE